MVWIHGGAYTTGQSNDYAGDYLVERSNQSLVVVTVNYRLAQFGFLASSELQQRSTDGSTGNYGIADQQLALEVCARVLVLRRSVCTRACTVLVHVFVRVLVHAFARACVDD